MQLPFDILPTRLLVPLRHEMMIEEEEPSPQRVITSVSSGGEEKMAIKRELDESAGLAILEYLYRKKGGALAKESSQRSSTHKSSFYMDPTLQQRGELDAIDRLTDSLGIPSKAKIRFITKEVLMRNDVSIQILIEECRVGMADLKAGGLVETFNDLIDLKFRMRDTVIDRTLFNVSHLYTLFHVGYRELRRHPKIQFSTLDLLECEFYASELLTLQFSFDRLIERRAINAIQLQCLKLSLADLITLGLQPHHLHTLKISKHDALERFAWNAKEYREFVRSVKTANAVDSK